MYGFLISKKGWIKQMDFFDLLTMVGGLSLFLFGMNLMGQALERRAGNSLKLVLGRLTTGKVAGILTGVAVTAVIQSSSATTVMVVGFVNSGLMTLKQAINVIMGANVGTTVTAWILSLGGISGDSFFIRLLKPSSFTPILALIGIILQMASRDSRKKDTGMIFLGFATLMFGMETMTGAVSGLAEVPAFRQVFVLFKNPILGVLAGALLTAIIQSSSASVGILQALATTGQVTNGAAIPIIMGQNIGTCITAILSSIGANKNARRTALVHLFFNIIGTVFWLVIFGFVQIFIKPAIMNEVATQWGIAVCHSAFNILCMLLLCPASGLLEKLVMKLIPEGKTPEHTEELDERLLATPSVALERCHEVTVDMAKCAVDALKSGMQCLKEYTPELAEKAREEEDKTDHYEDMLGTYLVKLSTHSISDADSKESAKLLKLIGDFERISDHGVNLVESAEELKAKDLTLTGKAQKELQVICMAVGEILDLSLKAFVDNDMQAAHEVEPLEQVIDELKEQLRTKHILRLQQGECSMEAGFVWADLLTNLERTSDHCSNIAGCIIDMADNNMNLHETLKEVRKNNPEFDEMRDGFAEKYSFSSLA